MASSNFCNPWTSISTTVGVAVAWSLPLALLVSLRELHADILRTPGLDRVSISRKGGVSGNQGLYVLVGLRPEKSPESRSSCDITARSPL